MPLLDFVSILRQIRHRGGRGTVVNVGSVLMTAASLFRFARHLSSNRTTAIRLHPFRSQPSSYKRLQRYWGGIIQSIAVTHPTSFSTRVKPFFQREVLFCRYLALGGFRPPHVLAILRNSPTVTDMSALNLGMV